MLKFNQDTKNFHIDSKRDHIEPRSISLDQHCNDIRIERDEDGKIKKGPIKIRKPSPYKIQLRKSGLPKRNQGCL